MTEHEERANKLDDEVSEMEERAERLEDEISDTRDDWESKKADPSVPGAPPDDEDVSGPQPETSYPSKGDEDEL